jgi:tRNA threonylcarbamoyladenosine biosynthesis protein TsaE
MFAVSSAMSTPKISCRLENLAATQALGQALGRTLPAASILLLHGDLGSGKTTLVQSIGEGLGINDGIVSPTFTLINEYDQGRLPLYHLDLYRLEPAEVAQLHLETYWQGEDCPLGIVAIEWAERLPNLPSAYLQINLQYQGEQERKAELTAVGQFNWGEFPSLGEWGTR